MMIISFFVFITVVNGQSLMQKGKIVHLNYQNNENLHWHIKPDCDRVSIVSTKFDTELNFDYVTIDKVRYSGASTNVDQIVSIRSWNYQFTVSFTSNNNKSASGFVLEWECIYGKVHMLPDSSM